VIAKERGRGKKRVLRVQSRREGINASAQGHEKHNGIHSTLHFIILARSVSPSLVLLEPTSFSPSFCLYMAKGPAMYT
jgi:hypothetical protein